MDHYHKDLFQYHNSCIPIGLAVTRLLSLPVYCNGSSPCLAVWSADCLTSFEGEGIFCEDFDLSYPPRPTLPPTRVLSSSSCCSLVCVLFQVSYAEWPPARPCICTLARSGILFRNLKWKVLLTLPPLCLFFRSHGRSSILCRIQRWKKRVDNITFVFQYP